MDLDRDAVCASLHPFPQIILFSPLIVIICLIGLWKMGGQTQLVRAARMEALTLAASVIPRHTKQVLSLPKQAKDCHAVSQGDTKPALKICV